MKTVARTKWLLIFTAGSIALAGCAHRTISAPEVSHWQQAQQLVLVITPDWNADHGTLRQYERSGAKWHETGLAQPVMIGRAGAGWGLGLHAPQHRGPVKREGDGRSPAGVFAIGEAFGYTSTAMTTLPYAPMQDSSYCVDVSGSPLYNQIVDAQFVGADAVAKSTEPMRRDLHADGDQRYRLGFVIKHNAQGRPMAGSCIFAHLWKSPTDATTGCTAMDPGTMDQVLAWLRPGQHPVFVLLPMREYTRLRAPWRLPAIATHP